jgi:hypothetical protein
VGTGGERSGRIGLARRGMVRLGRDSAAGYVRKGGVSHGVAGYGAARQD